MSKPITGAFYHGEAPGTLCFVPTSCVTRTRRGLAELDRETYIRRNWHILNLKVNPKGAGGHLFPAQPLQEVKRHAELGRVRTALEAQGISL